MYMDVTVADDNETRKSRVFNSIIHSLSLTWILPVEALVLKLERICDSGGKCYYGEYA